MSDRVILSVGIDIGTTSTHLAVSRLHLANIKRVSEPTRLVIERREIVYQSPIYFTPLTVDGEINAAAVSELIRGEYASAKISSNDIATGAVIITGESARKRNAAAVVDMLSDLAGQFVVASAGPNLESILAGRGSGAAEASRTRGMTICNVDIGGGTTNIAVFQNGDVVTTGCLAIGGRFVQVKPDSHIDNVTDSGEYIAQKTLAHPLRVGDPLSNDHAQSLATFAAQVILSALTEDVFDKSLTIAEFHKPLSTFSIDEFWFSGGVAALMSGSSTPVERAPHTTSMPIPYGDLGALLASEVDSLCRANRLNYRIAPDAIRATVIGAGSHSVQLSGSTVAVSNDSLPIANLPVVRLLAEQQPFSLKESIASAIQSNDLVWETQPLALLVPNLGATDYQALRLTANELAESFTELKGAPPLTVICSHDIAAALGQMLRALLPDQPCIVLDGIGNDAGDFIDIGLPLANQQAVPVVIKDLIFSQD